MFDPTAFDNIKVVIEGAIYDKDLEGEVLVTNRKDFVNLANLSRTFKLAFTLREASRVNLFAELEIHAGLKNLAAELLEMDDSKTLAGCVITVVFHIQHRDDKALFVRIQEVLEGIWGRERMIEQTVKINPLKKCEILANEISVNFNRLILEEQMGDLTEMIDYIVLSLKQLEDVIE